MSEYRYLFSPLRLGPLTLRNRIVFSAHLTNYAHDGLPTEQHAVYYAARAAGGAGLVITEEHSTHPTDWPYEKLIHGFRPEVVPGYRQITEAVHAHDVPVLAQVPLDISLREGGDVGKPIVEADPTALAARELTRVAQTLAGRGRGLAGMQLGLTPSSRF